MTNGPTYLRYERFTPVFERSPEEALSLAFEINRDKGFWFNDERGAFIWTFVSYYGMRSSARYGRFKRVRKSDLIGRKFEITLNDYYPSITFLDVVHDERKYKPVPIENATYDFNSIVLSKARVSNFNDVRPFLHGKRERWPMHESEKDETYVF